VQCANANVFVKRHHCSVRTVATLHEEHHFSDHLRATGMPVPEVLRDTDGRSARAIGDWVYEVHTCAAGVDVYRETISWVPLANLPHAHTAGAMLARLHTAAADYHAPQRDTHILVARSELLCATDPIAALQAQLPQRPQLAGYLRQRDWQTELAAVLAPWHAAAQPRLAQQTRLWTHGDWHVSNLCWSSAGDDALRWFAEARHHRAQDQAHKQHHHCTHLTIACAAKIAIRREATSHRKHARRPLPIIASSSSSPAAARA
jgi:Ser/Thr protein kinase RdoA (MazF antagonist)